MSLGIEPSVASMMNALYHLAIKVTPFRYNCYPLKEGTTLIKGLFLQRSVVVSVIHYLGEQDRVLLDILWRSCQIQ